MSNKDLDKLFKNKLEELDKAPTRDLWADIDEKLPNKNNKGGFWILGIAASLLILISVGITFYVKTSEEPEKEVIAKKEQPVSTQTEDSKETSNEDKINSTVEASNVETPKVIKSEPKVKPVEQKPIEKPGKKNTIITESTTDVLLAEKKEIQKEEPLKNIDELKVDESESIALNQKEEATTNQENASSNKHAGSTITFDINDLGSKEVLASNNTDETKKESKLKQLFKMAKDLKEGESGISNLREAKNELFAMNFRKDENGK